MATAQHKIIDSIIQRLHEIKKAESIYIQEILLNNNTLRFNVTHNSLDLKKVK